MKAPKKHEGEVRWNEAKKDLERVLKDIAPFKKEKPEKMRSTAGQWQESSSSSVAGVR